MITLSPLKRRLSPKYHCPSLWVHLPHDTPAAVPEGNAEGLQAYWDASHRISTYVAEFWLRLIFGATWHMLWECKKKKHTYTPATAKHDGANAGYKNLTVLEHTQEADWALWTPAPAWWCPLGWTERINRLWWRQRSERMTLPHMEITCAKA